MKLDFLKNIVVEFTVKKKYITIQQIISILEVTSQDNKLKVYDLLKPLINCSTVKMEDVAILLCSHSISIHEIKLKFLKDIVVELTVEQMNLILQQVTTIASFTKVLEIRKLLSPFIKIPINTQKSFKIIKFIVYDFQKIEYAKFSFDKIDLLPNTDLHSILESIQDNVYRIKFVELFVDKMEISISNLLTIIKLIPTKKSSVTDLFISKGLQVDKEQLGTDKLLYHNWQNYY